VIYVPEPGFVGADTFEYRVCDQGPDIALCDSAIVHVSVDSPEATKQRHIPNLLDNVQLSPQWQSSSAIDTRKQLQEALKEYTSKNDLIPGTYRYTLANTLRLLPQKF
jgi:hypothetical protein